MDDNDALRLAALLCSRLSHDLAGPVGALTNGLELVLDRYSGQAAELTRAAGSELKTRLAYFRRAYGTGEGLTWEEAQRLAEDYLAGGRYRLGWGTAAEESPPHARLVLNMILCAMETTPGGAALTVTPSAEPKVQAEGDLVDISMPSIENLYQKMTPRQVQPVFTAHLAWGMGLDLDAEKIGQHRIEWRATAIVR